MFTHQELVSALREHTCAIIFTKVDGSERALTGTLKSDLLPEEYRTTTGSLLTEGDGNNETIAVYDTGISGWRSFRVNSVTSFKIID